MRFLFHEPLNFILSPLLFNLVHLLGRATKQCKCPAYRQIILCVRCLLNLYHQLFLESTTVFTKKNFYRASKQLNQKASLRFVIIRSNNFPVSKIYCCLPYSFYPAFLLSPSFPRYFIISHITANYIFN